MGHLSIDSIMLPTRHTAFTVLGGSVAYVSLAAQRLGVRTSIISKVGADFPEAFRWWLQQEGTDLTNVTKIDNAQTTRFDLRYNVDLTDRILHLTSKAPLLTANDVPQSLKAKIIHMGPIAGEITLETVKNLRSHCDVLTLDPQGLARDFDEEGNVDIVPLTDQRILETVDVFKSSLREIQTIAGTKDLKSAIKSIRDLGVRIVIVTLGADGATVSVDDEIHRVPAYTPQKVVDPTGAGDAFIGGFLAEYSRGEDCSWCSYVGSAAASVVVEGIGPTALSDREEVYRRAHILDGKEIKQ